jgi:glycyl-tRNA synthetase
MEKIVAFAKRRGFAYPGSAIYGGFANSYTYGPYGVELKKNIKDLWWKTFVQDRQDVVGIDGDIIIHPKAWKASGHLENFNDQMVDCKNCRARLRADHIVEEQAKIECEGLSDKEVTKLIADNDIKCPKCGKKEFTDVRKFNMMFSTQMAKTHSASSGQAAEDDGMAYLRPETAQAIFLEFKNVVDTMRVKLPFGIGQTGKAFRNEITPGNFIFRRLEFEQMEIEYFIEEKDWEKIFAEWQKDMKDWCTMIGLDPAKLHDYEHPAEKLSHYSKRTIDIEYDFPFGRKELYGLAYRTDFDLGQHEEHSKQKLRIHDEASGEKILPHVIEPTWGLDRSVLAVMCDGYTEEKLEDGSERTVFKVVPKLAPVKIAVLPLMKKDGMGEKAKEIFETLKIFGNCEYDESGAIGKRYRRQDEIGTPVCVTVDYDTLEDGTVTVRDRDTMAQERVKIEELLTTLGKKYF